MVCFHRTQHDLTRPPTRLLTTSGCYRRPRDVILAAMTGVELLPVARPDDNDASASRSPGGPGGPASNAQRRRSEAPRPTPPMPGATAPGLLLPWSSKGRVNSVVSMGAWSCPPVCPQSRLVDQCHAVRKRRQFDSLIEWW